MNVPARSQLAETLRGRRDAIADSWYQAVARNGYAPLKAAEVRQCFAELTDQTISFLVAESFERGEALAIGVALTRLRYLQPEALGRTQEILAQCLVEGLSADQVVALQPRLAALLGGMASGFFQQAYETILTEQEAIRHALATELRSVESALREANEQLEMRVEERTAELAKTNQELQTEIAERKRAEEALRQRTAQLEALRKVGLEITAQLNLDTLLHSIASWTMETMRGIAAGVCLHRPEQDVLETVATVGDVIAPIGSTLRRGESISGRVWEMGEPVVVDDYQHWAGRIAAYEGLSIGAMVSVPICWGETFLGVLSVVSDSPHAFTQADAELLNLFATQAAIAIRNARLYEQARQDAETKATLLHEVNHRVKNNLSAIVGLLYFEQRRAEEKEQFAYQSIFRGLNNRIYGLATVHSLLSASEWSPLLLSELTTRIIHLSLQTLPRAKRVSLDMTHSPVRVTPDQAHNLALVINELTINTIKYALPERNVAHVDVRIELDDTTVVLEFRDDGPGYPDDVLQLERHNVGLDLIKNIVCQSLRGELSLHKDRGAVTIIRFKKATDSRQ